ncbi:MAG TPA: hypothetical protein EYO73_05570 [Sulfurimonas sp.]|nr:hypothetical protein [Sulfurimonas sp.]
MIGYYLFRFFETVFLALPYALQKGFISFLGHITFFFDFKHKRIIQANLEHTIKDKISQEKYETILSHCHKNLIQVVWQVLQSTKTTVQDLRDIVSFENEDIVNKAKATGKPIIFISAHYGNWELGGTSLSALISPTTTIHKKMNDNYFDDYLMKSRTKFNMNMVEKRGAIKHLIKTLKKGGSISMLIDQSVKQTDGIIIDFLGQKATQTAAPAFLARKFDAIIIPLLINNAPNKERTITFYEPIITAKTDNEEQDILNSAQAQADFLSNAILQYPEPWFWCHKRFKAVSPEMYK